MGWAARLNTTERNGQRPARRPEEPRRTIQPLAVFTPTRTPLVDKAGAAVKGPDGLPRVIYGFRPNAERGAMLTDEHFFDGRAVRRFGKVSGKVAKRARRAQRLAAARLQVSGE